MIGYVHQRVIHKTIPESSERAFLNAGKNQRGIKTCLPLSGKGLAD